MAERITTRLPSLEIELEPVSAGIMHASMMLVKNSLLHPGPDDLVFSTATLILNKAGDATKMSLHIDTDITGGLTMECIPPLVGALATHGFILPVYAEVSAVDPDDPRTAALRGAGWGWSSRHADMPNNRVLQFPPEPPTNP